MLDLDGFKFLYSPKHRVIKRKSNETSSAKLARDVDNFVKNGGVIYQAKFGETSLNKDGSHNHPNHEAGYKK